MGSFVGLSSLALLAVLVLGQEEFLISKLLIFYELWAGERLPFEKAHPRYLRPGGPISVSASVWSRH